MPGKNLLTKDGSHLALSNGRKEARRGSAADEPPCAADSVRLAWHDSSGPAVRTGFDPPLHSWRMPNRFPWRPNKPWVYGLCGGLCFAALDYWELGLPLPPNDDPAHLPAAMLAYLWRRQLASMAPPHMLALAWWLLASDAAAAERLSSRTAPYLCAALDAGHPTPLMLVRTRRLRSPWENHQVIAYGYRRQQAASKLALQIYDPNHPGLPVEITVDLDERANAPHLVQSTGEPLRGLFPLRYRRVRPPLVENRDLDDHLTDMSDEKSSC